MLRPVGLHIIYNLQRNSFVISFADGSNLLRVVLCLQFNQHRYAVAQVETMEAVVGTIKYTPTFAIYRNGRKVDEVVGKEPERLADHLWLHAD